MELHFTKTNGPVDEAIDRLVDLAGDIGQQDLVREMILAALKAGQENEDKGALRFMSSTLKEMRFTAKAFAPYREVRKVSVFGSARTQKGDSIYEMAHRFGEKAARAGYMVITGGGPGIMQAVNEGAGPEHSFGVNIRLPFEQKPNPILEGSPRSIMYKYFFNRKIAFLKEADAVVLFPGGFGTLDEAMETLTLLQTGKHDPLPVILVDAPGGIYWSRWLEFLEKVLLQQGYIGACDCKLFDRVDSVDDAILKINRFYFTYHSLRYVGDRLVIRLKSNVDKKKVAELKERFSDILTPQGDILLSPALAEEASEPEIADLPRLVIDFDRKDFGRLRNLIDVLNNGRG